MAPQPIHYHNRYTNRVETEEIYGEAFLRWAYYNPLGRLCLHALVKRAAFSKWYGWRMNRPRSRKKIQPFITRYQVDTSAFADPPESYQTFNQFFYRKLQPSARPISNQTNAAVFPADGRHFGFQNISAMNGIFVKGQSFELSSLLQNPDLTRRFSSGTMILSRLCPLDYHRFHFPVQGIPGPPSLIPGPLYSVSPIALRQNIHILAQNKRSLCHIPSPAFGLVLMLEIGATNVGAFEYTFTPGQPVPQGQEKGFFKFGGSSIITLFEPNKLRLCQDLTATTAQGLELYAYMGDIMGEAPSGAVKS